MDVGEGGVGFGSSAAIWFLWARRLRVRVWAFGVRALSLGSSVCAASGAAGLVMCGVWWCRGAVLDAQVGELPAGSGQC